MSRPKRFRGMELTEYEAGKMARRAWPDTREYHRIIARAQRLLPLWRKWGLEQNTCVSPWRSLKDDPPNNTTGRLIALRGPIPETPEEASQYFGCSGYVYGYMKRYGHHWDNSNNIRLPPAVFTHWMEVPE